MEKSEKILVTEKGILIEKGLFVTMIIESVCEMENEELEFMGDWFIANS